MLSEFVRDLFRGRPISVGPPTLLDGLDLDETLDELQSFEADWQLELPGNPPRFVPDAALWSAKSLYTASSLLIHRDSDANQISQLLSDPPPDRTKVESHYAVDLTMRFLNDLVRLARSAACNDPLVDHLMDWARTWPLSSVGIEEVQDVDIEPLRTSPTVMRLYIDRIVALNDTNRINAPDLRDLAAASIGDFPELNSQVADIVRTAPIPAEVKKANE